MLVGFLSTSGASISVVVSDTSTAFSGFLNMAGQGIDFITNHGLLYLGALLLFIGFGFGLIRRAKKSVS